MYKSIVLAAITAAVLAEPESKPSVINAAPLAVAPETAPAVVAPLGYQIAQTYNDLGPRAPILANTPSVVAAPLLSKSAPIVEASRVPTTALSAHVAAKSFPIIAAKAAPVVAAPALSKAPLAAAPLVVNSAPVASLPATSRAAFLAGPRVSSAYNSLTSPYVLYPYVSSPYVNGVNYI